MVSTHEPASKDGLVLPGAFSATATSSPQGAPGGGWHQEREVGLRNIRNDNNGKKNKSSSSSSSSSSNPCNK